MEDPLAADLAEVMAEAGKWKLPNKFNYKFDMEWPKDTPYQKSKFTELIQTYAEVLKLGYLPSDYSIGHNYLRPSS